MPETAKPEKPSVVINPFLISWKNVIIGLLVGTTLIGAGLVGYYYFQLKTVSPPPPATSPKAATNSAKPTNPSAKQVTSSAKTATPSAK